MKPEDLGYNTAFENFRLEKQLDGCEIGRVTTEHKERYIVRTTAGEYEAEITGAMRFAAESREDFPAVGDWVALATYENDFAIIHQIFPRYSVIKRQAAGQFGEIQIIAANIDYAFLVQAADRDFNINRLERYLTICNASRVRPLVVLSKIDLIDEAGLGDILDSIKTRIKDVPVIAISNETRDGYARLEQSIEKGKTYCMLGSSGVGKSTLLNNLTGKTVMATSAISQSTHKGKHVTSHRELVILENGGLLIDNPGMREVGIVDTAGGLETTFDPIFQYSKHCRFRDCTHSHESGCAVIQAVADGKIDRASYENYSKMEKERAFFESSLAERREKGRNFGKMLKNFKKDLKKGLL